MHIGRVQDLPIRLATLGPPRRLERRGGIPYTRRPRYVHRLPIRPLAPVASARTGEHREEARRLHEQARMDATADLRRTRAELDRTLGQLKGAMDASLDWREWVRRHPWPFLAVAAALGFKLGRGR